MIEKALHGHLQSSTELIKHLTTYNGQPAVFNQQAPADTDPFWQAGGQYPRIVFSVDIQGDPERTMGGNLIVDVACFDGTQQSEQAPSDEIQPLQDEQEESDCTAFPEDLEPIVRSLINGFFFSSGKFTVNAQWKDSSYFTEPTSQVIGVTLTFSLLAFPIITTAEPDPITQINEWTAQTFDGVRVINYADMPDVWQPAENEVAVYWRIARESNAGWIRDNFQTTYRTATIKGHIFAPSISLTGEFAREIAIGLYSKKRLYKSGTSPIIVNRNNTVDIGADPLRTGQLTIEATYGVIIHRQPINPLKNVSVKDGE